MMRYGEGGKPAIARGRKKGREKAGCGSVGAAPEGPSKEGSRFQTNVRSRR